MATLVTTKASFPKSGGLAVANGAVSVNTGNGLHVNPSTGMIEVPVDTTAGLGYGSNGLEVEVDGTTVDFNSSGQLTAIGGGGSGDITYFNLHLADFEAASVGEWHIDHDETMLSGKLNICGLASSDFLLITSLSTPKVVTELHIHITSPVSNPTVNGIKLTAANQAVGLITYTTGNVAGISANLESQYKSNEFNIHLTGSSHIPGLLNILICQ